MIYTEVNGRCGNQLFMYAVSRQLEEYYGTGITFNFNYVFERGKSDNTWKDDLKLFNVKKYLIDCSEKQLISKYGNLLQKMIYRLYKLTWKIPYKSRPTFYKRQEKLQPILNIFGIYDMVHGYYPIKKTTFFRNQFVCGTYEDERFFIKIRDKLLKEITPLKSMKEQNKKLYKMITENESVCVSFRRGDFLNSENADIRDVCNIDYYKKAIKIMKEKIPNAKFIFFSDDIEWVKNNCDFGVESYYENGNDDVSEKLRIMSSCKHFIMSNSTFCWWAQFLSKNENKTIISPENWFRMEGYKHQLIGKDWILINEKENSTRT